MQYMVKIVTITYVYHQKVEPEAQEAGSKALDRKPECMDAYHHEILVKSQVGLDVGSYLDLASTRT